jgi:hypothetical protein
MPEDAAVSVSIDRFGFEAALFSVEVFLEISGHQVLFLPERQFFPHADLFGLRDRIAEYVL